MNMVPRSERWRQGSNHGSGEPPHAAWEIERRGLDLDLVRRVLTSREQRISLGPGREVFQSRHSLGSLRKTYLVRVVVDPRTDTLSVILKVGADVAESDETRPGIILDFDANGDLVSLEILDASRRVTDADRIEFQTVE